MLYEACILIHTQLITFYYTIMANLNKVMIIGNLTADPELRQTPRGTPVTELRLAVNRFVGGGAEGGERREETTFLDVTCWGRLGEIAASYLQKGRPVFIEGRLQMDSWEDKQTGQKRSRIRIIAENLQLIGSRDGGPAGQGGGGGNYRQNQSSQQGYQNGGGYNNGGGNGSYNNNSYNNGGYNDANNYQQSSRPAPSAQPLPEEDDDIPF